MPAFLIPDMGGGRSHGLWKDCCQKVSAAYPGNARCSPASGLLHYLDPSCQHSEDEGVKVQEDAREPVPAPKGYTLDLIENRVRIVLCLLPGPAASTEPPSSELPSWEDASRNQPTRCESTSN